MILSAETPDQGARAVLAQAYQPIIRGYFLTAAIYYAIMAVTHFWTLDGNALLSLASVAIAACLFATAGWYILRRPQSLGLLEAVVGFSNLLILANVIVALHIEYSAAKLVYFIIMAMIFAFASVTMRQALVSIIAALGGLFFMIGSNEPDQLLIYSFVAFAAALSAFAIAIYLRRAIKLAVTARQDAETALQEAETARQEADTARQEAEGRLATAERMGEAMRLQSLSDSLTGLPNRRAFFEVLDWCVEGTVSHWLALLDLDGFKAVNDHYGHIIGDALLQAVAFRLQEYCGTDVHVSRLGGDEFNFILSSDESESEVENWCQGLLTHLAEVYLIEDRMIQISGSIGCHRISHDEPDANSIQKADYALLHAKRNGKNRVVVFREEHAKDAAERFTIEQALRIADLDSEIQMLFQPQHDLSKSKMVCAEALARWNSPTLGRIEPSRFIQIAEECGLISRITVTVVDKALAALKTWGDSIPVSINLSGHDLISDHMVDLVIERVKASGISPSLIEFEVTETAMMPDTNKASANLHRLAAMGHPISLDDFGTGYSNFSYLRSLPITKLKVDRSFIQDLGNPMAEKILRSLIGLAKTLNVHCLLEGIENEVELVVAKRAGAQSIQGYLFGRPMPSAELKKLIDTDIASEISGNFPTLAKDRTRPPAGKRVAQPKRRAS
jgi:diguanylate cyclase (GGDEF)-like protein